MKKSIKFFGFENQTMYISTMNLTQTQNDMKTLREIMTEAHSIARTIEGANYSEKLSTALKMAWAWGRKVATKAKWELAAMVSKHANFSKWDLTDIEADRAFVFTDKAVLVAGDIVQGSIWLPLSCVNILGQFEIQVPGWLLCKKGLNYLA